MAVVCAAMIAIAVAAATTLLNDTPTSNHDWGQNQSASQSDQCDRHLRGLGVIISRIGNDPEPKNPEKDRQIELCQQLSSADSAKEAARVAWLQLYVGAASLVGLIFTVFFAWRAVMHTKRQANTAGETLTAQSRAWMSESVTKVEDSRMADFQRGRGFAIPLLFTCKNFGYSPANSVFFYAETALLNPTESLTDRRDKFCDAVRSRVDGIGEAVFPGQETMFPHVAVFLMDDINRARKLDQFVRPAIYGCVSYSSPHVNGIRQTRFCYQFTTTRVVEGHGVMPVQIDASDPKWVPNGWVLMMDSFRSKID